MSTKSHHITFHTYEQKKNIGSHRRVNNDWGDKGAEMVTRIHLGLITDKGNLDSGLVLKLSTAAKTIRADYTMVTGKRSHCTNRANEKTFTYTNANNMTLEAIVRLYNDDVAIRYRIPQGVKITDDCTSFYVADGKDR